MLADPGVRGENMIDCASCHREIDTDSVYCDQCGTEILICPTCGEIGTTKFCLKDGTRMKANKAAVTVAPLGTVADPVAVGAPAGLTQRIVDPTASPVGLRLRHASGSVLTVNNGDVLGRREGAHTKTCQEWSHISGRHGRVSERDGKWYYQDLGSTNGSYINGARIEGNRKAPVTAGDRVRLADQEFTVL